MRILKSLAWVFQVRRMWSVLIFSILNHPCSLINGFLSIWRFSFLVNYYFQVSFNLEAILDPWLNSFWPTWRPACKARGDNCSVNRRGFQPWTLAFLALFVHNRIPTKSKRPHIKMECFECNHYAPPLFEVRGCVGTPMWRCVCVWVGGTHVKDRGYSSSRLGM